MLQEKIPIRYVLEQGDEFSIKFDICREPLSKCSHNLNEQKFITLCYDSSDTIDRDTCGFPGIRGFIFNETLENRTKVRIGDVQGSATPVFPHGTCVPAEIYHEQTLNMYRLRRFIKDANILDGYDISIKNFENNLKYIDLHIYSTNTVCGFYFKFVSFFLYLFMLLLYCNGFGSQTSVIMFWK